MNPPFAINDFLMISATNMDVSKNRGTPKWMVKIMENPIKMDDLGGKTPYFWFNTHMKNLRSNPPKACGLNAFEDAVSPEVPRIKHDPFGQRFGSNGLKLAEPKI